MSKDRVVRWRAGAGITAMAVGSVLLVGAYGGAAGAAGGGSTVTTSTSVVSGNPTCAELVGADNELKIEDGPDWTGDLPEAKTYEDPDSDFEVTISNVVVVDGKVQFDFTSNIAVSAVFVKAGPGGILYTFDPPSTTGTGLVSPKDSVSHISFCWDDDDTTTTEGETTTTGHETTTTEHETTTTEHDETTTTEHDDTTTSSVGGTSTSEGRVTTTTVSPGGSLPRTGSNTMMLVGIGAALLLGGGLLVASTRQLWRRHV